MLLKRHRIPRRVTVTGSVSDPVTLHGDRAYWHWTDLKIGSVIDLYAKRYHICSTDEFTRDYLESEGISMKDKEVRFMKIINHNFGATFGGRPLWGNLWGGNLREATFGAILGQL